MADEDDRRQPRRGATTDALRSDIDEGRTGEKVAISDPALAPLGTDDEAAGTPADPETVAAVRAAEAATAPERRPEVASPPRNRSSGLPLLPGAILLGTLIVLIGIFMAAGFL